MRKRFRFTNGNPLDALRVLSCFTAWVCLEQSDMAMLKTRITELFGIEYPIVGGCMMHISKPEFVAAVSSAGALGMMASAMYITQDEFRQAVRRVKDLTDKPFGVNLSLHPAIRPIDNSLYIEVILEEEVPVAETSGHRPPEDLLTQLKAGEPRQCTSASVFDMRSAHKRLAPTQ